ncbi:MAG TPA: glycine dehydrogenase [Solirubrobacteraceae bacterium]|nr:glycine dehydrogenase [Solirubrobacteraceae bacterium]
MTRYTATTDADRSAMLQTIGVDSVQELFDRQIPESVRLRRALDLPPGMTESDVYEHLRELAARNVSAEQEISFLGAGMYDHYVPALIDMLLERSEFLTPYTPYQPEVSQGGLQVMFEYQTAICELTGLPVANASVYEGASAVASAAYLAKLHNGRPRIVASAGLHPHTLQTLRTYAHGFGGEVVEVGLRDGRTDPDAWAAAIDADTSAAIFAQPNFYGAVEDARALSAAAKGTDAAGARGAGEEHGVSDSRRVAPARDTRGRAGAHTSPIVVIAQVDPIVLGVLAAPGECGVDVAVGEGQPLGNRLDYGGPSFGFFAAREEYLRRMPGRIAGETRDLDGRRGFVLTLQTREQHIRREKATSNICTAQALNALAGVVHLAWLGRRGLVELGELLLARTHYARQTLAALPGVQPLHHQPVVRELALRLGGSDGPDGGGEEGGGGHDRGGPGAIDVAAVRRRCLAEGVNPGIDLHGLTGREGDRGGLLVALTERRGRADIDRLAEVLGTAVAAECERRPEAVSA